MLTKAMFTEAEWQSLRNAPQAVILAVATAGSSGLIGTLKEAFAPLSIIAEAMQDPASPWKELFTREELAAAQASIKSKLRAFDSSTKLSDQLTTLALDEVNAAVDVLMAKGQTEDREQYRTLLIQLADRVANAAKEGSFFGLGGQQIGGGEQQTLDRLHAALLRSPLQATIEP